MPVSGSRFGIVKIRPHFWSDLLTDVTISGGSTVIQTTLKHIPKWETIESIPNRMEQ